MPIGGVSNPKMIRSSMALLWSLFRQFIFDFNYRPKIRRDLNGLVYLNQYLELLTHQEEPYDDQTVTIICEAQKVLYNLIHDVVPHKSGKGFVLEEQDSIQLAKTTQLVRLFLLRDCKCPKKIDELYR